MRTSGVEAGVATGAHMDHRRAVVLHHLFVDGESCLVPQRWGCPVAASWVGVPVDADIAVFYDAKPSPEIETNPLQDVDLFLVRLCPPCLHEDPELGSIALREVAQLPLVIPGRPNAIRMQVESEMANIRCCPKIALEIDGVFAILDLVVVGEGSAVLSCHAVANSVRPSVYTMRAIREPLLRTKVSLATSSLRPSKLT